MNTNQNETNRNININKTPEEIKLQEKFRITEKETNRLAELTKKLEVESLGPDELKELNVLRAKE